MKKISLIACTIWIAILGTVAFGQIRSESSTLSVPLPLPPPLDVEIREQHDSPLQLSIDDKVRGRMPGSPLVLRNAGASTIAAFVLRMDVEPHGMGQMVIVGAKGLAPGESRIYSLSVPRVAPEGDSGKPAVWVDYVRFADGKTWGEDSLGRSKRIAAYLEGRSLAMSRLNELLVGRDDSDFRRAFDMYGFSSFAEPNILPAGRGPRDMDWSSRGYDEVLNILRRMPRNSDLARDLARQIEVMAKPTGN